MPTPTRAARSPAWGCATTAARSCSPCSRASPTGCAPRSTLSPPLGPRSLALIAALGPLPDRGRVSGGGARSDEWLRIVASVLELPLERTAADEGAAFGAGLVGGGAGGPGGSPPAG